MNIKSGVGMSGEQWTISNDDADELLVIVKFQDQASRLTLYDKADLLKWLADSVRNTLHWANKIGPVYEPISAEPNGTPALDAVGQPTTDASGDSTRAT